MGLPDPSFADEVDVTQEGPVYVKPGCAARHVQNRALVETHTYVYIYNVQNRALVETHTYIYTYIYIYIYIYLGGNRRDSISTKIMFDNTDFKEIQVVLGRLLGGI